MILMPSIFFVKTPPNYYLLTIAILLSLFSFLSLQAQSLPYPERADWGPSTFALGGASAAVASNHDSFMTNPAGLVYFIQKNSVGGNWQRMPREQSMWSLSLVDGTRNVIGGFHFNWTDIDKTTRHTYVLAAAYKTPYGSLGVTIKPMRFSDLTGDGNGWHLTGSTGVLVPVAMGISFGGYVKSFLDGQKDSQLPPSAHLGVLYTYGDLFRVTFDADRRFQIPNQDWNYSVGGEVSGGEYFVLRGGYRWQEDRDYRFWSSGASFVAPRFELSGHYTRTLTGSVSHGFGFDATARF